MNTAEIWTAKRLLADRTDRTETIIDGDGQSLTAHWIDGGQRMFTSLAEVRRWLADRKATSWHSPISGN